MKRLNLAAVLGLALSLGLLAIAPTALGTIVIGQGVAGVKLGQSQTQVEAAIGAPGLKEAPDFEGVTSWAYPKGLEGTVSFDSKLQVSGMWTASKRQKTSKGVGPGSSLAQVRRAYPKASCSTGPFGPKSLSCKLKSKDNDHVVETSFLFFTRTMGAREVDIGLA
ncbi:MAG: hypothetical protein WAN93_06270 [Solirubrobacteraceae bacterium]